MKEHRALRPNYVSMLSEKSVGELRLCLKFIQSRVVQSVPRIATLAAVPDFSCIPRPDSGRIACLQPQVSPISAFGGVCVDGNYQ